MNAVFKVIWNISLNVWVAVGEFAKGKQKSKTTQRTFNSHSFFDVLPQYIQPKIAILAAAVMGAFGIQPVFAITPAECTAMGASCVAVSNVTAFNSALTSGTATTILLLNDITMNSNVVVNQATSNRKDLVIDGGGYSLSTGLYAFTFTNQTNAGWGGVGSFTLSNMTTLASTTALGYSVVSMDTNSAVNIIFDNVGSLTDSMQAVLGAMGDGGTPNLNSQLVFGNITQPIALTFGTNHQFAQANNVKFTGSFVLNATTGSYPAVLWTNAANANSIITLTSTADVSITTPRLTNGYVGRSNGFYMYMLEDGAKFTLNSDQYVFDTANNGLKIGSYNSATGFGAGAVVKLATQSKGAIPTGNGISNTGGSNTGGTGNGAAGAVDVIYNLAADSLINVSAAGSVGILATKTGTTNNSGIYISSGAAINAVTAGISASHAGTGNIILENKAAGTITAATGISATNSGTANINIANKGAITAATGISATNTGTSSVNISNSGTIASTTAGISVSSTAATAQTATVNNTGGTISASSGTGINVLTNALLNMVGGTITTTGAATGFTFAGTSSNHVLTDLILNLNSTGVAFSKAAGVNLLLNHITFNTGAGTALNSLAGLTFADSVNGKNIINVTGAGIGINSAGGADLNSAYLDINVTNSAGIGLQVTDGAVTTIGTNTQINALGATAINFTGTTNKTLNNYGTINGAVIFTGTTANTINNNGILNGTLTTGSGNDVLVLGNTSQNNGAINLGDGSNDVTIENGAQVSSITTGIGNDTFTINGMTAGSTYLGSLNAGSGTNTLNFNTSVDSLTETTSLQGFTNINLTDSQIALSSSNNVGSGTINIGVSSELIFNSTFNGILNASLGNSGSGDGVAVVDNDADVSLSQASAFAGDWQVNERGTLTVSNSNQLGDSGLSLSGTLNLNGVATFNNSLLGAGLLNIDTANNTFNFGVNTGTGFAGTVDMKNSIFTLSGNNTAALLNASLIVSAGTAVAVDNSNQTIGNFSLNGGTTAFANGSLITTDTLAVTNNSNIRVDPTLITGGNLLDQDTGNSVQLIDSSNTLSATELSRLTLLDILGNSLGSDTSVNVVQGVNTVAQAIYDYALSGVGGGLSMTSVLTRLALISGQTLTLTSQGASDTNKLLTAQLTGSGNLAIGADNSEMTLSNTANNYTGSTSVIGGILNLGSNNALGQTSALNVLSGASANINGYSQTVGALTNAGTVTLGSNGILNSGLLTNSNTLNLAGGTLNLSAGGTSTAVGGLTGSGNLNINGGDLVISATNSGLAGQTTIASGASATLNNTGTLGSSAINVLGDLNLNGANAVLANVL
ncbi:TPA: pectate lyase-like adhesive domain-containing protein, partial [Yersinia enterocolitica]